MRWWPFALLVACEAMPPTGAPLQPVPSVSTQAPRPTGLTAATPVPDGSFPFDEDEGEEPEPNDFETDDPATLLALAQGLPVPPPVVPARVPRPALFDPFRAPDQRGPIGQPAWDPATATAPDWGVRLVSTMVGTQPPRAVLGLPDGTEVVVKPGTMLSANRLVVMAVGRDVVQVSRVIPEGYQARIETRTLRSFYPATAPTP